MATVVPETESSNAYLLDPGRLDSLHQSGLLSADWEPALDRWTRLGSRLIGAPLALFSLIDRDRQYFKSQVGLSPEAVELREAPLSHSYCKHVVATRAPLVVADAREHPLLKDNPAVAASGVLAYAGRPVTTSDGHTLGSFCVADTARREWTRDELELLEDLAAGLLAEIELRAALRRSLALKEDFERQARVDALTGLANRRQLSEDLGEAVAGRGPQVLAMFDLDGFKGYNDAFGHPAGDALLVRLSSKLARVADADGGRAYRLGGDEFCVLLNDESAVEGATTGLREHGEGFSIGSSHGVVRLDDTPLTAEQAMLAADQRLYGDKNSRSGAARQQAQDVLLSVLREREPALDSRVDGVAGSAQVVARRLGMPETTIADIALAAKMHDIGKVAIPDSIIDKPGPLDEDEWKIMRQHTILGQRILSSAPALGTAAFLVRSSHERWDGNGYPDGLAGSGIPLGSRIILVCDAYHAMTCERPYAPTRSHAEAIAELRAHAGRQFDAAVVESFVAATADASPALAC